MKTVSLLTTAALLSGALQVRAIEPESVLQRQQRLFNRSIKPYVARPVSVVGFLKDGKFGGWLEFAGWGAYVRACSESELPLLDSLNGLTGTFVLVAGVLRHQPAVITPPGYTGIPEHFYFCVAEIQVTSATPSRNPQ
jgi:hypothetical protein